MGADAPTGRELFDALRRGVAMPRTPIVAPAETLAARIAGVSFSELTTDATLWANAVAQTTALLGLDAVLIGFDFDLMGETLDDDREAPETRGRLRIALDAADRLFKVVRGHKGCIAAMPGPLTLAAQRFGADAAVGRLADIRQAHTAHARAWCATRPDLLLIIERDVLGGTAPGAAERRAYGAIRNVAGYYAVSPALWTESAAPQDLAALGSLGMDFVVPVPAGADAGSAGDTGLGIALDLTARAAALARAATCAGRPKTFLINRSTLSPDIAIETVRAVIAELRDRTRV